MAAIVALAHRLLLLHAALPDRAHRAITTGRQEMFNRKGFTLIELLIVVVIIGILAAIAIPKFATTKDKAKLASVKTDLRNYMTAQEAYFSDYSSYGSLANLQSGYNFTLSAGNTGAGAGVAGGWTATFTNASISGGTTSCRVGIGTSQISTTQDGVIVCP
jgi:prepilin-type N-terminal cleavage/methylation domain-containing protein